MKKIAALLICYAILSSSLIAQSKQGQLLKIIPAASPGAFPLVKENSAAAILIDEADATVVRIAASAVASDIGLITDVNPDVVSAIRGKIDYLVIAGTIGQSAAIDELIKTKKLAVSKIKNKWESYIITTINAPMKGVKQALVIAGSNPRGTAYGLFELSRMAGVSPWIWWADVVPAKHKVLSVVTGTIISKEPSVKYRGIFLNDEDWGLQPWAAKTFEPETGDIGPKTYAKIFELLLRLKANLIWPAMHEVTKPFFTIAGNAKVAEDYAIIIGSSHAEPMLRSNTGEWDVKRMGNFNYVSNKDSVLKYWEDRVKESKGINAMYSIGMRGVHDSKMEGVKDAKEAVPLLQTIFKDQRDLLSKYINKDLTKIPQVFTAYKEVLEIYDYGLKLPEDVTLVWPDDNYGYIQRLNNSEEKKRSGGSGVYYHASYWGRPHDYLWLSTTHPSLVREEMMKAFENGSNRLWVLNVGDIKPAEYITEMFMDMAYNAAPFKDSRYPKQHLLEWLTNLFGKEKALQIQPVLWDYYQLAFERKPEYMGWSQTEPTTKTSYTTFNHFSHGDEAQKRIDRYQHMENKVKALRKQIDPKDDAAYYELVYYPVVGASWMNKKFLYRDKSYFYSKQNRLSAAGYAQMSLAAYDSIVKETEYFNNQLSGGKWKHMMSMKPRNLPVFLEPELPKINIDGSEGWSIAPEGFVSKDSSLLQDNSSILMLPAFDAMNRQTYFIDIFLTDNKPVEWKASVTAPWIQLSKSSGQLSDEVGLKQTRLFVTIDWDQAPKNASFTGQIKFEGNGKQQRVVVSESNLDSNGIKGFIENNGYVKIKASHYSRQVKKGSGDWQTLADLGYAGEVIQSQAVSLKDTSNIKDSSWIRKNSSYVEYEFYTFSPDSAAVTVFSLPTHPLNNFYSMRYAISIDNGPIHLVDFRTFGRSDEWKQNVLRNRAERKIQLSFLDKGMHHLRIYSVDPGVMVDEVVVEIRK